MGPLGVKSVTTPEAKELEGVSMPHTAESEGLTGSGEGGSGAGSRAKPPGQGGGCGGRSAASLALLDALRPLQLAGVAALRLGLRGFF